MFNIEKEKKRLQLNVECLVAIIVTPNKIQSSKKNVGEQNYLQWSFIAHVFLS